MRQAWVGKQGLGWIQDAVQGAESGGFCRAQLSANGHSSCAWHLIHVC